jgi:hypothetical protein
MSANEIRALEDMNRIPSEQGGDLYLLNGNMITAAAAGVQGGAKNENLKKGGPDETQIES